MKTVGEFETNPEGKFTWFCLKIEGLKEMPHGQLLRTEHHVGVYHLSGRKVYTIKVSKAADGEYFRVTLDGFSCCCDNLRFKGDDWASAIILNGVKVDRATVRALEQWGVV